MLLFSGFLHKHWKRAQEAYPMVASKEERDIEYLGVAAETRLLKRCSFSYSWDFFVVVVVVFPTLLPWEPPFCLVFMTSSFLDSTYE